VYLMELHILSGEGSRSSFKVKHYLGGHCVSQTHLVSNYLYSTTFCITIKQLTLRDTSSSDALLSTNKPSASFSKLKSGERLSDISSVSGVEFVSSASGPFSRVCKVNK
jgi:hypothetical protein